MTERGLKRITRGGGSAAFFGLPVLLLGIYLGVWQPYGISRAPVAGAILGVVLVLVGAGFLLGRNGVILDRNRHTVTQWWGLLVPFYTTEYQVGPDALVRLSTEIRRSRSSTGGDDLYTVFPIMLQGKNLSVVIDESREFDASRRLGEEVAKFFNLPIHDLTGSEKVIRQAGKLDESVHSRAWRLGIATPLPTQPPGAVCTIQYSGPRAESMVEIPALYMDTMSSLVGVMAALIVLGYVLMNFLPFIIHLFNIENQLIPDLIFGSCSACLIGAGLFAIIRAVKALERITIAPSGVRVVTQGILRTRTLVVPANEIEEIETTGIKTFDTKAETERVLRESGNLSPKQREGLRSMTPTLLGMARLMGQFNVNKGCVVLRTDRGSFELGKHLVRAEKEWLRNVLLHVLTSDVTAASSEPAAAPQVTAVVEEVTPAETPDYPVPPRISWHSPVSGGAVISVIGVALLGVVLYKNGVLDNLLPQKYRGTQPVTQSTKTYIFTAHPGSPLLVSAPVVALPGSQQVMTFPEKDMKGVHPETVALIAALELAHGVNHPMIGVQLYLKGLEYQTAQRPKDQEWVWLHALQVLQAVTEDQFDTMLDQPYRAAADKEIVAGALGAFYWSQQRYEESYNHYELAHRLAGELHLSETERNGRLAYSTAGIMTSACYLSKWDIADQALVELKNRIQTLAPEERESLDNWIRTNEPRLKNRKC